MRKVYLTLIAFFLCLSAYSQDALELDEVNLDIEKSQVGQILEMFSFTLSTGSGSINNNQTSSITLGDMNISYKLKDRLTLGLSTMGNLSGCPQGYTNAEGQYVPVTDDDNDDDVDDVDEMEEEDNDEDEDCDEDELSNLMGTATYRLSEKIPVFIQAAAGYSFESGAPAISAFVGYNKELFSEIGVLGGVRFSNVFINKPVDAASFSSYNIRAELGITWNF